MEKIYIVAAKRTAIGSFLGSLNKVSPSHLAGEVIKNILEGVGYIHERGYMHRDLKPENILLCESPSSHIPMNDQINIKIVDFGLSVEHKNGPVSLQH